MKTRILSTLLAIALIMGMCTGCGIGKRKEDVKEGHSTNVTTESNEKGDETKEIAKETDKVASSEEETTSKESSENTTVKEENTTNKTEEESAEQQTTKKPEPITTKPQSSTQETTKKPSNQNNTTKPTESKKPTVKVDNFTYDIWSEPVKAILWDYTDNDIINVYRLPSADSERAGWMEKGEYGYHGHQVTILGTCKENGWYRIEFFDGIAYVSGEHKIVKQATMDTPYTNYDSMEDYEDALYINNYFEGRFYLVYDGEDTVSGEEVKITYNRKVGDLLDLYSSVMPYIAVKYYDPQEGFDGDETVDELLTLIYGEDKGGWTETHYRNGEALAKFYGLDFHGSVQDYAEWGKIDYSNLEYEVLNIPMYWTYHSLAYWGDTYLYKDGDCIYAEPLLGADPVCMEVYSVPVEITITKQFKNWDWYEVSYECYACNEHHTGYMNVPRFEEYLNDVPLRRELLFTKSEQWEREWLRHHDYKAYLDKYVKNQ